MEYIDNLKKIDYHEINLKNVDKKGERMKAYQVIKKYIDENWIRYSFVADNVGMNRELFSRSMDGKRVLKADEFIKICILLSLDLEKFNESEKASAWEEGKAWIGNQSKEQTAEMNSWCRGQSRK